MSDFLTKKEFEAWVQNNEKQLTSIGAVLAGLVHVQGGAMINVPFIQVGNSNASPVTFDHAFKGGTTPKVVPVSVGFSKEIANITGPSNTGFSFTIKYADDSGGGGTLNWIAIGEKA